MSCAEGLRDACLSKECHGSDEEIRREAGSVGHIEEIRNEHKILVWKSE
jgi:hypothetical protein